MEVSTDDDSSQMLRLNGVDSLVVDDFHHIVEQCAFEENWTTN